MRVDGVLSKTDSTSRSWEADLMQAAYLLELLCRSRLEAETSRAKLYMNIHHLVVAGNRARADDLRRFIPATEATVVTLNLLGEALRNRIIALRSGILLAQTPTPRWAESWRSLSPIGTRRTGP
ncbi:MAG: hypothetical protein JWQ31_4211 [Mycobacterium sp.]|jgi:hypothetical protein|nr:hypothetical protein [Mycobacterium sp.]MDQ1717085.1 hypothetical protein [Pseudonocardiales bacterium]MDT5346903.1 hypothetical protein [Mycobacterium sp.]